MATYTETRKSGDALLLSGEFTGEGVPADADWSGATAEIHIVDKSTLATEREDSCPITAPNGATAGRYDYIGAPIAVGEIPVRDPGVVPDAGRSAHGAEQRRQVCTQGDPGTRLARPVLLCR
jgi:hypothetical protein